MPEIPKTILRLLPPRWSLDQLMKDVAVAFATAFEFWKGKLERLHEFVDPNLTPDDWLDWLMSVVALPTDLDLAELRKRSLIKTAIQTWSETGPAAAIERYVKALTSIAAVVLSPAPDEFIAGISLANDIVGSRIPYYSFEIQVPAGSISEAELRRLLLPVVGGFNTYTVTFV